MIAGSMLLLPEVRKTLKLAHAKSLVVGLVLIVDLILVTSQISIDMRG